MNFVRRRARSLLIYPSFQLSLVIVNGALIILVCAVIALLMHRSFENLAAQGTIGKLSLAYEEQLLLAYLGAGLGIAVLFSCVINMILSHRVAGPIMRTKTYLEGVKRYFSVGRPPTTEIPDLKFRKGDYFEDLPDKINGALHACVRYSETKKDEKRAA